MRNILAVFVMAFLIVRTGFFVSSTYAAAGINETINFQGKLVGNTGLNVADGNYDVVFYLYAASSGGSPLWTETWNSGTSQVTITDGVFRVALGTHSSFSSFDFNQDSFYLAIKVGTDAEMTPRIRFTSVPYAFVAKTVVDDALDFAQFQDILDLDANLTVNQTGYTWTQTFTGTTTNALTYNSTSLTSGSLVAISPANVAQTGNSLYVSSTSTAAATNGLARFNFTGAHTGNGLQVDDVTTTGNAMAIGSTALTTGTGLLITGGTTLQAAGELLDLNMGAATTGSAATLRTTGVFTNTAGLLNITANAATTGTLAAISGNGLTTGTALNISRSGAGLTTNGELINLDMGAAVAGNGINIATTGVYTGTGLLTLTANSATSGTVASVSNTGLTTGTGLLITGGTTLQAAGELLDLNMGAATTGSAATLRTTGVFTNTAGLLNITANAATTGYLAAFSGTGLTTGTGLLITGGAAMAANGELLDLNMGAAVAGNGANVTTTGVYTGTGLLTLTANSATTGDIMSLSATGLTTGSGIVMTGPSSTGVTDHFLKITSDVGSASSLIYGAPDFSGSTVTGYGLNITATDSTATANTDYANYSLLTLTGNAAKSGYGTYGRVTTASTTADTTYGGYFSTATTGAVTTGTQSTYGLYATTTSANVAGGTVNAYGGYFQSGGTVASGTINSYGLYIANGTMNTTGTANNFGLYVEAPTGADTNVAGYFGGNVGIGTTSPTGKLTISSSQASSLIPFLQFVPTGTAGINTVSYFGGASNKAGELMAIGDYGSSAAPYHLYYSESDGANPALVDAWQTSRTSVTQTNADIFFTRGSVGIGTTAPTQALHVVGSARITGALYDSSNSAGSSTNILTSTGTGTAWSSLSSALDTTYFKQNGNSFTALAVLGTNDAYGLAFETSNTERLRIDASGNVGIGTTAPSVPLEVRGDIKFGGVGSNKVGTLTSSTTQVTLRAPAGAHLGLGANGGNSDIFINSSGNVGIGTTAPAFKLEIAGTSSPTDRKIGINGTQVLYLPDQTSFTGTIVLGNGGTNLSHSGGIHGFNNALIGIGAGAAISTGNNNVVVGKDAMLNANTAVENIAIGTNALKTITWSGANVAIGFNAGQLVTDGDQNTIIGAYTATAMTTGFDNILIGYQSGSTLNTGGQNIIIGDGADVGASSNLSVAIGYGAGSSSTGGSNNLTLGSLAGLVVSGSNNILVGYRAGDALTSGANNIAIGYDIDLPSNTASNQLSIGNLIFGTGIDGTGTTLSSGNIGIGTTSPTQKLHVVGSARITGALYDSSNSAGSSTNILTSTGSGTAWSNLSASLLPSGTEGQTLYNNAGIWTATNGLFYDDVTGNVGIGTTSPGSKLQVAGNITPSVDDTYDLGTNALRWQDLYVGPASLHVGTSTTDEGTISYDTSGNILNFGTDSTSNGDIAFFTNDLYLDKSTGSVGIGTTAPSGEFEIYGDSSTTLKLTENTLGRSTTITTDGNGTSFSHTLSAAPYTFAGNLVVNRSASHGGLIQFLDNDTGATSTDGLIVGLNTAGATNDAYVNLQENAALYFSTNSTERLRIDASGNVGIGTTNPRAQLTITGDTLGFMSTSAERARRDVYDPVGTWVNTGATMATGFYSASSAVIGDYIYIFGGQGKNTIQKAPVRNPTAWVNTGATLPTNLGFSSLAVIGDYIYLFGGWTTVASNIIYRAPISDPTAWVDTGSTMPGNVLNGGQLEIIKDTIYYFGGDGTGSIYSAPVSNPTSWSDTTVNMPIDIGQSPTVVIGDYIYIFGSSTTTNIYRAPITDPTNWSDSGGDIPAALYRSNRAIIGDYIYAFGGKNSSNADINTIYRAPLSNPLAWETTGSTLPGSISGSSIHVIGDYVYLFGGGANSNVIYRAGLRSSEESKFWKYAADTQKNQYQSLSTSIFSDGAGKVGIGTTSPAGVLDITAVSNTTATLSLTNNTATTIGNAANTLGVLDFQSTSLTTGNFLNMELNGLTSGKGINLTSTSTGLTTGSLLNIQASGNPGASWTGSLGTIEYITSTDADIDGSVLKLGITGAGAGDGTVLNLTTAQTGTSAFVLRVNDDGTYTDTTPFIIDVSGNVGIGTTNPGSKLQIAGDITPSANDTYNLGSDSLRWQDLFVGPASLHVGTSTTDEGTISYDTSGDILNFSTDSTTNADIAFFTNVLYLDKSMGNIGIGTTAPGYTLDVKSTGTDIARFIGSNSTGCTLSDGGIIACSSDRNLKKNILDTNLGLDAVMALRPVEFNWNSQVNGDKKYLGFIAQDVETLAPNLVTTDSNGYKQLNSIGLIPIVAKAIQEQQGLINTLQTNVQIPDFKIATVSSKLETLNTKVSSWDGLFITIQSVIQSIQDAIVALRDQFGLVQSDITSTKSEVASLSASLTSLNSWKEAIASGSGVLGASDSALLDHVATVSALTVQNQTTTFDLTVLNKLTTGVIELGAGIDGDEINASTGIRFQTLSQGPIDFMNGKVIIDVDGNLKAVKVSADRYAASKAQGTVGLGLLKAGDTSVTIETPSVNANSRIFVTALTKTNKPLYVSAIIEGSHFVVSLGETPLTNVRFNWWIVEEE